MDSITITSGENLTVVSSGSSGGRGGGRSSGLDCGNGAVVVSPVGCGSAASPCLLEVVLGVSGLGIGICGVGGGGRSVGASGVTVRGSLWLLPTMVALSPSPFCPASLPIEFLSSGLPSDFKMKGFTASTNAIGVSASILIGLCHKFITSNVTSLFLGDTIV